MTPVKKVEALQSMHATPSANARLTLSASTPLKIPHTAYDPVNAKPERIP